jgi:hypothetical protein
MGVLKLLEAGAQVFQQDGRIASGVEGKPATGRIGRTQGRVKREMCRRDGGAQIHSAGCTARPFEAQDKLKSCPDEY